MEKIPTVEWYKNNLRNEKKSVLVEPTQSLENEVLDCERREERMRSSLAARKESIKVDLNENQVDIGKKHEMKKVENVVSNEKSV